MRNQVAVWKLVLLTSLVTACADDGAKSPDVSVAGGGGAPTAGAAHGGLPTAMAGTGSSSGTNAGGATPGGSAGSSQAGSASTDGSSGASGAGGAPARAFRRVAYLRGRGDLKGWQSRLDFSLVSHIVLAFASVDAEGNLSYDDAALGGFVAQAHQQGVGVCVALGGGATNGGLGTLATLIAPDGRGQFIQKIATFAQEHELDCIDVDFEGAGVNGDYAGFVTALAQTLHQSKRQLSAALAAWYGSKITDEALQAFDFVNVMAYDLHNPAGTTTPVHGSALNDAKKEIDYWVQRGLDKNRAVLGVPFYGYRWTSAGEEGEAITYADILETYGASAAAGDEVVQNGTTVYYDGRSTVAAKVALAKDYGGTMIWELSQDAAGDAALLRAMHEAD